MTKKSLILVACLAALGVQHQAKATLVYDFETITSTGTSSTGRPNSPATGPDGFFSNGVTPVQTTQGATQGTFAMQLSTASTFTGAETQNVPLALSSAASLQYDLTIPTGQTDPGYADLEATYYTTDGALNPDRSVQPATNIDLPAGTYTQTLQNLYIDPEGILTVPSTPAAILAADSAADIAAGFGPDAITGFQFDFEHGASLFTIDLDNVQVPPIAAVPEPTSIAGLVLGGGALLARRRKA